MPPIATMMSYIHIALLLLGLTDTTVTGEGLRGTEFWFAYAKNVVGDPRFLRVAIVTESSGLATFTYSDVTTTLRIEPGVSNLYDIDDSVEGNKLIIENKGIMLNTTVEVNIFVFNRGRAASDSFHVLPISQLSTTYIATTGPADPLESQIVIISPFDDNEVNITLKMTSGSIEYNNESYSSGEMLRVQLNKFDTFHIMHTEDLSGTSLTSSMPVAVLSGDECPYIISGHCSHATEMIPPVHAFSNEFIVPIILAKTGGTLHTLAAEEHTNVSVRNLSYSLGDSEDVSIVISVTTSTVVRSTRKIMATLFLESDPFMITIPGVDQYMYKYNFFVFDEEFFSFLSVIIRESSMVSNILLDGSPVSCLQQISTVMNDVNYTVCTLAVSPGVHLMNHTQEERFGLFVYGFSKNDGYGYTADINIGTCNSLPCKNNGTCHGTVDSYVCTCVEGYYSSNCETDINECSSDSCRNGGTCNDDVKPYTCTCASGFTGVECATEIDECSSSPCQNGASCTDNVNSYTCTCFDGYTGINCDTDAEPFSFSGVIWLIFGIGIGVTISIIACIIYILIKRTRTRKRTDDTDDPPHIYFSAVADSNTNHEYESMTQSGRLPSRNLDITGQYLQVVSSTAFDAKDHHVGLGN